ncbi:D-alanyl-D-alanine carboxypeptidase [Phormidesmis priestleyi ULC007]|uniref:D-alanyl-D-alanine carboxypeptidase n=2 Tax=Phormidesmis priestleyi TaxID=268141 RepID=A0A2T1DKJ7_9CYAN|nr:D-alanyl-D-alanine carboxypeptidase [Phormidesmis priestleyi ULC007]PZO51937.1 MAG: D-alanyl-D-alanine carboxypeptidase [Phormidesmis priestleyi]
MLKSRSFPIALLILGLTAGCTAEASKSTAPQATASPISNQPALSSASQSPFGLVSPTTPDAATTRTIQQYLKKLANQGFSERSQGVWMQSGTTLLANHQGTTPLSAASLTKVATSLAALQTFGVDHRFVTEISSTGTIENGILKGDLIVQGGNDPLFVWEEAIAVGNLLNQLQIRQVTGNLIVVGRFYMNFDTDPKASGELLKQGLNAALWSEEVKAQHLTLPAGTPRPQVTIAGDVKVANALPANAKPLLRHQSLPLAELLKKMNRYSNNAMAEIIASTVGGAKIVSFKAAQAAGVPQSEVLLVNGSGLGTENRLSPRAVCAMFLAIERSLEPFKLTVADIFTVVGQDSGVLDARKIPALAVTKSGSLDAVSALAGALPTSQKGVVWFVVINGGNNNLEGFRSDQEALLRGLSSQWGAVQTSPAALSINSERSSKAPVSERVN